MTLSYSSKENKKSYTSCHLQVNKYDRICLLKKRSVEVSILTEAIEEQFLVCMGEVDIAAKRNAISILIVRIYAPRTVVGLV